MSNKLTENQVKNMIGINDWRNLSKDKLMKFVSILPNVDNEVAIKIIEQFPEFSKNSVEMLSILKNLCDEVLADDKELTHQSIDAYKQILDELALMLKQEDLSAEERRFFANKMIEVADKISMKDTESKEFKGKLLEIFGKVTIGTLLLGAVVLGAKFINDKTDMI